MTKPKVSAKILRKVGKNNVAENTTVNLLLELIPTNLHAAFYGAVQILTTMPATTPPPNIKIMWGTKIWFEWMDGSRLCILNHKEVAYKINQYEGIVDISDFKWSLFGDL